MQFARAIITCGFAGLLFWSVGCGVGPTTRTTQATQTTGSPATSPSATSITSISPNVAVAGGPDLTVTILGANFENDPHQTSIVAWSTSSTDTHCCDTWLLTTFVSSTQPVAVVPASLLQHPTTAHLFVETGDPQGITDGVSYPRSNTVNLSVVAGPIISGFSTTGSVKSARSFHSASSLQDGRGLIVGGGSLGPSEPDCDDILALDSAEIYNPNTGVFTATGNLLTARFRHTATPLSDGKVLISGGEKTVGSFFEHCSEPLSSVELFDPSTGSFTAASPMRQSRSSHTATLLSDGRVLIAGGSNLATAEIYNPSVGQFSAEIPMTAAREGHAAVLLPTGKVLSTGGCGSRCASAELYDPVSNTSHVAENMTTERAGHTATLLQDGKVLIVGGRTGSDWTPLLTAEIYDPETGLFSPTGSMQVARYGHRATLLADGRVLITGGTEGYGPLASAELYDPTAGQFTTVLLMNDPRSDHTSTLLNDKRLFIVGGGVASAELYQRPH